MKWVSLGNVRGLWLCILLLGLGACASAPRTELADSIVTSSGVHIAYKRCSIPGILNPYGIQLRNVRLTYSKSVRSDPQFNFAKKGISELVAVRERSVVESLERTFKWACSEMKKGIPERADYLAQFHDEAFKATFETALRLEKLSSDEEYLREISAAGKVVDGFRARERDSWTGGFFPAGKASP